ncbi:MAG: UDP-N-acetylmuramoyl-tripeptide--D-alanyl-D-alanine ligase [Acidobacteriota bacterium]
MVERLASVAAAAMGGEVFAGEPATRWRGAAIDSRRIGGGEIFFALAGERTDGHAFVPQAVAAGASAVVVHRDTEPIVGSDAAWIRVEDTYRGLHDLTRAVRAEVPDQLVGITGSAGKTTTKEILAAMLARRFRAERSPGNLNNLYGFPLSLLNIDDACEWMVAEMGMSTPGELRQVSLLGRPEAAVFTNVRPVHLENFRHLRDIADAKSELLAGLAPGGLVIANADDPEVMFLVDRHRGAEASAGCRYVTYGVASPADVTARAIEPLGDSPGSRFELTVSEAESRTTASVPIELPLHGSYNVENCLAAAACAHALGVPLVEIAAAVAQLESSSMRGQVHRLDPGVVIDDSYNSNPDAACKALASARQIPAPRYVAILGDMLELGPDTPAFHRQVGTHAAELDFGLVVGVGELSRELVAAAELGGIATRWFADADSVARWVSTAPEELSPKDLTLVKGSRGVGLEGVVRALLARAGGAS